MPLFVAAACAGALMALAVFSFVASRSAAPATTQQQNLASLTNVPQLDVCGGTAHGRRLRSAATAIVAGGVQRIDLVLECGELRPDYINVRAGVPVEIYVRGNETNPRLRFDRLGVSGEASVVRPVTLPALDPGIYPFSLSSGSVDGLVVAR